MLQKYKTLIFFGLFLLMVILLVLKFRQEAVPYNKVNLSHHNIIHNKTEYTFLDTTLSVTLDFAKVQGVTIIVRDLTPEIREEFSNSNSGVELQAALVGKGSQYILYVYRLNRINSLVTIAHEVIHLMQYRSGRIQLIDPTQISWEGDTISMDRIYNIPYSERPWEKEAFDGETALSEKVERVLYGNNYILYLY